MLHVLNRCYPERDALFLDARRAVSCASNLATLGIDVETLLLEELEKYGVLWNDTIS